MSQLDKILKNHNSKSTGVVMSDSVRAAIDATQVEENKMNEEKFGKLILSVIKAKNNLCCEDGSGQLVDRLRAARKVVKETLNEIKTIQSAYETFVGEDGGDPKELYIAMYGNVRGNDMYHHFCRELGISAE